MPTKRPRILGEGAIELRRDHSLWPQWLRDADTENGEAEIVDGRVVWWGGSFRDGVWVDGDMLGGVFWDGIWLKGNNINASWRNGDWRGGYFGRCAWYYGVFRAGEFHGWWQDGLWRGGEFKGVGNPALPG